MSPSTHQQSKRVNKLNIVEEKSQVSDAITEKVVEKVETLTAERKLDKEEILGLDHQNRDL